MIKYTKIGQLRNILKYLPKNTIVPFEGTVKLHGTNASVRVAKNGEFFTQSRNGVITPDNDNYGFAAFAYDNMIAFKDVFNELSDENTIDITFFGEWAGKGIQSNVGICKLERSFFLFDVLISSTKGTYYMEDISCVYINKCYNIYDFTRFYINIDTEHPKDSLKLLQQFTDFIEDNCPVAEELGVPGIGEGIVWKSDGVDRFLFKTKGAKHSGRPKDKKKIKASPETLKSIDEFTHSTVTQERLDQALSSVFKSEEYYDISKMGDVIKWVINDIKDEESDTLEVSGLAFKDVSKSISREVVTFFKRTICS